MPRGVYERDPIKHAKVFALRATRTEITCKTCGKVFCIKNCELKRRKVVQYCSKKCAFAGRTASTPRQSVVCGHCGKEFLKRVTQVRRSKHGLHYCSRECTVAARRKDDAKWHNKDAIREYMRDYYNRVTKHKKPWLGEGKRKAANARNRRYVLNNREKIETARHIRRTVKNNGDLTPDEWFLLKAVVFGMRCAKCRRMLSNWEGCERPTIDHIVPVSKGGEHTLDNVQPLCRSCNSQKNDKTEDYRTEQEKTTARKIAEALRSS